MVRAKQRRSRPGHSPVPVRPYGARVSDTSTDPLRTAVLRGARLTLRPWQPADAPAVYAAMQNRAMHRFLSLPDPYTEDDADAFITASLAPHSPELGFAMVDAASDRVVGSIGLRPGARGPHQRNVDVGYAVYPDAQGHRYAAEALGLVTSAAFEHRAARVSLECAVDNIASAKTALAAGFRFEGIARDVLLLHDDVVDGAMFARVRTDPPDRVPPEYAPLPDGGLSDGVIRLRELDGSDAAAYQEQQTDPVSVSTGFTAAAPTLESTVTRCRRGRLGWLVGPDAAFAIVDEATGRFAGSMQLRRPGPPQVGGLGYTVHPHFRGRGYTGRALRLVTAWAFDAGGFARLELGAKDDNVASQRAALAGGFEPDGVRAARLRRPDGAFADEVRFAVVNPQTLRRISP